MAASPILDFRDGIFALRTRRLGTVAELMIAKLYSLYDSDTLEYDKIDKINDLRIEIKFSTVMKKNESKIYINNVIDQCLEATVSRRALLSNNAEKENFDCNIQQIKTEIFDVLYYGLFFRDKIEIFKMTAEEVLQISGYSNKQHRGNEGEGQFHINNSNICEHRKRFLVKTLSYEELYQLFNKTI